MGVFVLNLPCIRGAMPHDARDAAAAAVDAHPLAPA